MTPVETMQSHLFVAFQKPLRVVDVQSQMMVSVNMLHTTPWFIDPNPESVKAEECSRLRQISATGFL